MHIHYDLRKYLLAHRIVALWNSLPKDVVYAHSVHIFKSRLDKFWLNSECKFHWKATMPKLVFSLCNSYMLYVVVICIFVDADVEAEQPVSVKTLRFVDYRMWYGSRHMWFEIN